MSSSAGSTRKARYLAAALVGFALALLAIWVSFWASYYTSPRLQAEKNFFLSIEGLKVVEIPLPDCTGERIFYSVNVSSTSKVAVALDAVRDGQLIRSVELGEDAAVAGEGSMLLDAPPSEVALRLKCQSCSVQASVRVRYSSVNYGYLLALNIVAVLSSIVGLSLLTVGSYGYIAARREESDEAR
jgi:hypothetical protein